MKVKLVVVAVCTALVTWVVMSVTGAFGAGTSTGTLALQPGVNVGVSCPNALSNTARLANSETVNCAAAATTTTLPVTTTTQPVTTTTMPVTTTTVPSGGGGGGGGTCTNPVYTTSAATGTYNTDPNDGSQFWWVDNDAWSGSHGPQTMNVCSEQSWFADSTQPNVQGQVETYPNSEFDVGGRAHGPSTKPISAYSQITSTFAESFPTSGTSMDAAYDLWLNNWSTEIMIWNEDSGSQTYWNTQGTPVTVGGTPYQYVNLGGEFIFIRQAQVKSGSVDILAVLNFLVGQGQVKASDAPTQLEYGAEVCSTTGTQTFPLTGLTFTLDGTTYN